ncbi:hypothetical protein DV096_00870 [Bradymonadaceae bacterium TMQ3]|nr:hypothetical protein DV096_00870 [Bradymonadaceae bacterium TMQ3]TXC78095.1 hypothetical protein FRC91_05025 [Bradymonadales bacterium TMQ1]
MQRPPLRNWTPDAQNLRRWFTIVMLSSLTLFAAACGPDDDPPVTNLCEDVTCERGVCEAGECVNAGECAIDEDCVDGFFCGDDSVCQEASCEDVTCDRGQCSEATGRCENAPACAISTQGEDCLEGFVCAENICITEEAFCDELACDDGRGVCSVNERACVNAENCEGSDQKCADGFFCAADNTCQANLCDDNDECARGVCDPASGQCVDLEVCAEINDCTDGSYCVAGSCQPEADACAACEGNQICNYDADALSVSCEENPAGCSSAFDCAGDRACQGGVCVDPVACVPDAFEPNDDAASATELAQTEEGMTSAGICPADVDVFTFNTLGRDIVRGTLVVDVRIASEDRGLGQLEVAIFGVDGAELSRQTTNEVGVASFARLRNAAQMGVHRIEVRDAGEVRDPGVRYEIVADVVPEAVANVCAAAVLLEDGDTASGDTSDSTSFQIQPSCAEDGSTAGERVFTFEVEERSRVELNLRPSSEVELTLSLRTTCESAFSEQACQFTPGAGVIQRIRQTLAPGTYFAVVKGPANNTGGNFNIDLSIDPLICSPGVAVCLTEGVSRVCNAQGTGFEEETCLDGCVAESGLCERPGGDTCLNPIDASGDFSGVIDWGVYEDEVSLDGGDVQAGESCLSVSESSRTFGPEVVYSVTLPAGHALQANLITTSDHAALLVLDDCADADLSCLEAQTTATVLFDGRFEQELVYTNETTGPQNLLVVASSSTTPTGDAEIRITSGEVVCTPEATACDGDAFMRCNASGTQLETVRECNFGCNPDALLKEATETEPEERGPACNLGTNQVCRNAIDILNEGGSFQGEILDYTNDLDPDSSANPTGCTGGRARGGDATFFVDASAGDVITAQLSTEFDAALWITTDCSRAAERCLAGTDSGVAVDEFIQLTVPRDGRYFIIVDSDEDQAGTFELDVSLALPTCTPGTLLGCVDTDTLAYCGPEGAPANFECAGGCTGSTCNSPRGEACFDAIPAVDGDVFAGSFNGRSNTLEIPGEVLGACDFSNPLGGYQAGDPVLGPDAIYSVDLRAGQALEVSGVSSAYSGVYYILTECGAAESCSDNTLRGDENLSLVHFAEQDETVFVVASRYNATTSASEGYVLEFNVVDVTCTRGERRCMDSLTAEYCTAAGEWKSYECLTGCNDGTCASAPADTCGTSQLVTETSSFSGDLRQMSNALEVPPSAQINGCFAGASSSARDTEGPDAFYEVRLSAGERLHVESSGSHHFLYMQDACGAYDSCLASAGDSTESTNTLEYVATHDETLFVVVDTQFSTSGGEYDIYFAITETNAGCATGDAYCMADGETLAVCDSKGDYNAYRCTDGCTDGRCGTPDARICEDAVMLTAGQTYRGDFQGSASVPLDLAAQGQCDFTSLVGEAEDYGDWITRVHAVDVRQGELLTAKLRSGASDFFMYITGECGQGSATCEALSATGYSPEVSYVAAQDETVYVVVSRANDSSSRYYLLDVATQTPGCSPGTSQCLADGRTLGRCNDEGVYDIYPCDGTCSGAACDQPVGDACFDAIPLVTGQPTTGTFMGTNQIEPAEGQAGNCEFANTFAGPETIYSIFVPAGQALSVELDTPVFGAYVYLLGECGEANSCVALARTDRQSTTTFVADRDRTIYVVVDKSGGSIDEREFTLTADYQTPECTPGQQRCSADGTSLQICNEYNFFETYACNSGSCSAGRCETPNGQSCQDALPLVLGQESTLTQGSVSWINAGSDESGECSISGNDNYGEAYRYVDLEEGDVLNVFVEKGTVYGSELMVLEDCFTMASCQVSESLSGSSNPTYGNKNLRYVADQARRVYVVLDDDGSFGEQTIFATVTPAECTPGERRCHAESGNIQLCSEDGIFEDDYQCDGSCNADLTCNPPKGDRCFDAIPLPGDGVAVSDNVSGLSNEIGFSSGAYGACTFDHSATSGYDRIYSVQASGGDVLRVNYSTTDTSSFFYVLSECGQIESCMANGHFRAGAKDVFIPITEDGTYYIVADRQSSSTSTNYTLEVEVMQPDCIATGITRCTPDGTGVEYCNAYGVLEVTDCQGQCVNDRCEVPMGGTCGDAIAVVPGQVYTGDFNGQNNLGAYNTASTGVCEFSSSNETHGADTFYEVSLRAGDVMLVNFTSNASEGMAYLVEDCRDIGTCLAQGVSSGTSSTPRGFEYIAEEDKTVFIVVDRRATSLSTSTYELSVELTALNSCTPGATSCSADGSAIEYCDDRGILRSYACAEGCVAGQCSPPEGDLCFDAIPVTSGETVAHELAGASNSFEFSANSSCYLSERYAPIGPDRVYSIELTAGDRLDVDFETSSSFNADNILMYVLDSCTGQVDATCRTAAFGNWDLSFVADQSQTYYVVVDELRSSPSSTSRTLTFNVTPAQNGEVCLPGESRCEGGTVSICNAQGTGFDTQATCEFGCERDFCAGPAQPNNTCADALLISGPTVIYDDFSEFENDYGSSTNRCGSSSAFGRDAVYRLEMDPGQIVRVRARSTRNTNEPQVSIVEDCENMEACLANDRNEPDAFVEFFSATGGIYYAVVDGSSSTQEMYIVEFDFDVAECVPGEQVCLDETTLQFCTETGVYETFDCPLGCASDACNRPANNTCEGALDVNEGIEITVDMDDFTRDYDPDLGSGLSCARRQGTGPDMIYYVDAVKNDVITASMTTDEFEKLVWITTDCSESATMANACVAGTVASSYSDTATLTYRVPTAGRYFIVMDSYDSTFNEVTGTADIAISVERAACLPTEGFCDVDGNLNFCAADGSGFITQTCASGCADGACTPPVGNVCPDAVPLTSGVAYVGDFANYTNHFDPGYEGCTGFDAPGPDAAFSIALAAGETVTATVSNVANATNDMALYLISDCGDERASCQAGSDLPGEGAESVTFTATEAGTYYLVTDSWTEGVTGQFEITATVN